MDEATELSQRLSVVLTEIRDIMEKRKERVEELRDQISFIENENEDLESDLTDIVKYKNSTTKRRAEFEALNLEKINYY